MTYRATEDPSSVDTPTLHASLDRDLRAAAFEPELSKKAAWLEQAGYTLHELIRREREGLCRLLDNAD